MELVQETNRLFPGLHVDNIECHRALGSVIGSGKSCNGFKKEKLMNNSSVHCKRSVLSPQNLYKSFTNGLQEIDFYSKNEKN